MLKIKTNYKTSYFISLLILIFTTANTVYAQSSILINDIPNSDPNFLIYQDLIQNKAFSLDQNGNFNPNAPINKVAFLKAALTYSGFQVESKLNYFTGYSDVPEDSWFAPYVKKALESRVLQNQLNDLLNPDQILNRQEGLLLTLNIFGLSTPPQKLTENDLFEDIRLNHPLVNVYAAIKKYQIYLDNDQNHFYPARTLTRKDAAELIYKVKTVSTKGTIIINNVVNIPNNSPISHSDLTSQSKFPMLQDAWYRINNTFINSNQLNKDQLIYSAINGMVNSLNDNYSAFHSPESNGTSYVYIPENYEGVGIIVNNINNQFVIEAVIQNSPAHKSGLLVSDQIIKIANTDVQNLNIEQVFNLIKGKAGTILNIQIKRNGTLIDYKITREKIDLESIQYKKLDNNINYIRISQFTENSSVEFENILNQLKESKSQKLIIDLRNNPGGYLLSTQEILNHFLPKGEIIFFVKDNNSNQSYISNGPGELNQWKIVILMNRESASASEIFAGALQDKNIGYIIGTTSFGKGSVQEITEYIDNSSLKLTIAHWLTPNQKDINKVGITPNKTINITDYQKQNNQDPQLEEALNYLKSK